MSLDVDVFHKGFLVFGTNITSNIRAMLDRARIDELFFGKYNEALPVSEALPRLLVAIQEFKDHPEEFRPLQAKNGWGTYEQALEWLEEMADVFDSNPDGTYICQW